MSEKRRFGYDARELPSLRPRKVIIMAIIIIFLLLKYTAVVVLVAKYFSGVCLFHYLNNVDEDPGNSPTYGILISSVPRWRGNHQQERTSSSTLAQDQDLSCSLFSTKGRQEHRYHALF